MTYGSGPRHARPGVDLLVDFLEGRARFANPHPLFDREANGPGRLVDYVAAQPRGQRGLATDPDETLAISQPGPAIPGCRLVRPGLVNASPQHRAFFEAVEDQLRR